MSSSVTLTTGARLHFGLLAFGETERSASSDGDNAADSAGQGLRGRRAAGVSPPVGTRKLTRPAHQVLWTLGPGRQFGGVGVMVSSPRWRLTVSKLPRTHDNAVDVSGASPEVEARIRRLVQLWRAAQRERAGDGDNPEADTSGSPDGGRSFSLPMIHKTRRAPSNFRVQVHECIPLHHGLGAGTQLALAVGQALSVLTTGQPDDLSELAAAMHRGRRSAVGIHGFEHGGFLVDAGKRSEEPLGSLAARVTFPPEWRFVLVTPQDATGLAGESEEQAFSQLQRMPAESSGRLTNIVLTELLPAARHADFEAFSESLYAYGRLVGECFSPVQGGRYAHPVCEELVQELRREGIRGVAQSSWGPTMAVAFPRQRDADAFLASDVARRRRADCRFRITSAKNNGADIHVAS